MLTSSFHNPYDPLQRSGGLVPAPVRGGRLAFRIGLGAFAGLLLAAAGSLEQRETDSVDRRALSGAAPQVVEAPQSPWGEAPSGEAGPSH